MFDYNGFVIDTSVQVRWTISKRLTEILFFGFPFRRANSFFWKTEKRFSVF